MLHPSFARVPPPKWFYEIYDAIQMNMPVDTYPSIRQMPLYLRYRYRLVAELLKESKIKSAVKAKAMGVIDLSNI